MATISKQVEVSLTQKQAQKTREALMRLIADARQRGVFIPVKNQQFIWEMARKLYIAAR